MKKFILIFTMVLFSTITSYAQYAMQNNPNVVETLEWKHAMAKVRSGKTVTWTCLGVGCVSVATCLLVKSNADNHLANGENIYKVYEIYDGNHNLVNTREFSYSKLSNAMEVTAIICGTACTVGLIIGIIRKTSGRKQLDRIYGIQNGIGVRF